MDILNCSQCGKPFRKKGSVQICTTCLDQEHEMYEFYYQKLSKLMGHVDFESLGSKSPLNMKRLEKALEYRLGTGDVNELVYWKRGTCHVCTVRLKNPDSVEPICVTCLDQVVVLLEKEPPVPQPLPEDSVPGSSQRHSGESTEIPSTPAAEEEMVPRSLYEKVLCELDTYRKHFGPLPNHLQARLGVSPGSSPFSADFIEIMEILQQTDEDIVLDVLELETAKRGMTGMERIQHYGFKRVFSA